jgi:hypothetical protein
LKSRDDASLGRVDRATVRENRLMRCVDRLMGRIEWSIAGIDRFIGRIDRPMGRAGRLAEGVE